jgi:hypothetical protein
MGSRGRRGAKSDHRADTRGGRFVGLPHVVVESEAYRHLSPIERAVLVEILARFTGYNNGEIAISYRELAHRLNRKNEAPFGPAVAKLIVHGLIDIATEARWKDRRAREYRLTFISTTDGAGRHVAATNEYRSWVLEERISTTDVVAAPPESTTTSVVAVAQPATASVAARTQIRGSRPPRLLLVR